MQQSPLDAHAAREAILKRLRQATAGRTAAPAIRPENSFVREPEGSPVEAFTRILEQVNGIARWAPDADGLTRLIRDLAVEHDWKKIYCPDPGIRELCMAAGLSGRIIEKFDHGMDAAVTGCEALVADLGSVVVSSAQSGSRQVFPFAPVHIVLASSSQIMPTADEAMNHTLALHGSNIPSFISIITGPSRTADIEKTLILGAHGPRSLYVLISEKDINA